VEKEGFQERDMMWNWVSPCTNVPNKI